MVVVAVSKFERFFRSVAGLDVDKDDLKRHGDFVNRKLVDLLVRGEATAKANGRDIIEPFDLPITKGLQERIYEFRQADRALGHIPVVLISSTLRTQGHTAESLVWGNADGFLLEPVEPDMLASTLRTVLASA